MANFYYIRPNRKKEKRETRRDIADDETFRSYEKRTGEEAIKRPAAETLLVVLHPRPFYISISIWCLEFVWARV